MNVGYLSEKLRITVRSIAQFKGDYGSPGPIINQVCKEFSLIGKNNFLDILEYYLLGRARWLKPVIPALWEA